MIHVSIISHEDRPHLWDQPHVRERINIYMRNTIDSLLVRGPRSEPRPTQFLLHVAGDCVQT